jgi:hypothetical protein
MGKLLLGGVEDIPKGDRPPHLVRDRNPHGGKGCLIASCNQTSYLTSGQRATLTQQAKDDLLWWQTLVIVAFMQPREIVASISSVRRTHLPDLYLVTNASSLVGGVGGGLRVTV